MRWLGRSATRRHAASLYGSLVEHARAPALYAEGGVPDSLDGRFESIALHVFLALRRLRHGGDAEAPLGQALFDRMFEDMDGSLREIGVGDLSVGVKVKEMARALYG